MADINLLHGLKDVGKNKRKSNRTLFIVLPFLIVLVASAGLYGFMKFYEADYNTKQVEYQEKLKMFNEVNAMKSELNALDVHVKVYQGITVVADLTSAIHTNVLDEMARVMPESVFASSYQINDGSHIGISAIAESRLAIADYIESLKATNMFENIFIASISETENDRGDLNYTFTITMDIIRGER